MASYQPLTKHAKSNKNVDSLKPLPKVIFRTILTYLSQKWLILARAFNQKLVSIWRSRYDMGLDCIFSH